MPKKHKCRDIRQDVQDYKEEIHPVNPVYPVLKCYS